MYKDDSFVFWENDVRFTRQFFIVQFVTESLCMQKSSHQHFRFGIAASNPRHIVAAGNLIMHIGHRLKLR